MLSRRQIIAALIASSIMGKASAWIHGSAAAVAVVDNVTSLQIIDDVTSLPVVLP